ncbi:putative phosphoinositide 3-phosphate phosphatase [Diaporthe ampelina]|uniref:phosphatidylinositol-3,4,5-trisphosphate 3-phosphatase n=1 Tax=Diaporthe ampelina TaxID=1214573 RepID=A0A0G2FJY2_9PEZI|nr:putative phosphoinositide 3-phosphate phosphatase [Diaporthe ampelina]
MASLLRQIVAGPRAKHAETGLDLCYVTDNIIVTSGPSQTYPQRAYRNPLDRLVAFLDAKHPDNWAIWEFRAEGTGYPDEAVYGRIRHYPWPDHHPPPFRMVPMIMASMRSWLNEEDIHSSDAKQSLKGEKSKEVGKSEGKGKRVVVVHCKAGKGRSGSMTCSYLISECGWKAEDALARFTERRMRPTFGAGVSIPSQLRWISYADRWTKGGKKYVDREVEVLEVHVWGLRHGVKVNIEGFADEGKKIKVLHTFKKEERHVVQGGAPGGGGVMDLLGDALSPTNEEDIYEDADYNEIVGGDSDKKGSESSNNGSKDSSPARSKSKKGSRTSQPLSGSPARNPSVKKTSQYPKSKTINPADFAAASETSSPSSSSLNVPNKNSSQPSLAHAATFADTNEPGGMAVIFKPTAAVRLSNSDVNVSLERRNRAPASLGLTMVTAVAHVWFNVFFEGRGPEQDGRADESGVFEIDWDKMDGIKGSSRKGTRAADRISVVWRVVGTKGPLPEVKEPGEGSPVPEMRPADWKGEHDEDPGAGRKLGLRAETTASASVSKASSVKSADGDGGKAGGGGAESGKDSDDESLKGVKSSDPTGQEIKDKDSAKLSQAQVEPQEGPKDVDELSEHDRKVEATRGRTANPDEASGASASEAQLLEAAMRPVREARANKASETAILQKKADEEASRTNPPDEHRGEASDNGKGHDGGERKLGFVKAGKKLLPLHPKKTNEDGKDPRVMGVSVKK